MAHEKTEKTTRRIKTNLTIKFDVRISLSKSVSLPWARRLSNEFVRFNNHLQFKHAAGRSNANFKQTRKLTQIASSVNNTRFRAFTAEARAVSLSTGLRRIVSQPKGVLN